MKKITIFISAIASAALLFAIFVFIPSKEFLLQGKHKKENIVNNKTIDSISLFKKINNIDSLSLWKKIISNNDSYIELYKAEAQKFSEAYHKAFIYKWQKEFMGLYDKLISIDESTKSLDKNSLPTIFKNCDKFLGSILKCLQNDTLDEKNRNFIKDLARKWYQLERRIINNLTSKPNDPTLNAALVTIAYSLNLGIDILEEKPYSIDGIKKNKINNINVLIETVKSK
ncbi:hypothetical protein HN511_04085 [bacterium]|jgi:hypothetical protein|nr:hypothetical protein [bacterium]